MILVDDIPVEFGQFPNGEVNLLKSSVDTGYKEHVAVTLIYENDSDLFHLLLVERALVVPATLYITYTPYSRMDRETSTYAFSLKTFAEFINLMDWDEVVIYEPHSDVLPALLDRVRVINVIDDWYTISMIDRTLGTKDYNVFYPDAGAQKRYETAYRDYHHLVGFKTRDFETGRITDYYVIGERTSENVVILDDLCSKGGTFMLAAEQLRELGYKRIILVVAHCEQTIFAGDILTTDLIEKVITTDSIIREPHEKIITISLP